MVKKIVPACLLVAIIGLWIFSGDSDKKQIANCLQSLAQKLTKAKGAKIATALAKSHGAKTLFASSVILQVNARKADGNYTREKIAQKILKAHATFVEMDLKIYDLSIHIDEDSSAQTKFTARFLGKTTFGSNVEETRELQGYLRKNNGKWQIYRLAMQQVLER